MTEQHDFHSDRPKEAAPPRRTGRRLWLRALVLILGLPLLFAAGLLVGLIGRDVDAPDWLEERVTLALEELVPDSRLDFRTMSIVIGRDLHPRATLRAVDLWDQSGAPLLRVPKISVKVSPRGLLFAQQVLVQDIKIVGAQLLIRRASDGSISLTFDQANGEMGQSDSFQDLLADLDRVLEDPNLQALERIEGEGLILEYNDARARRSWTVDGGAIDLDLRGDATRAHSAFSVLSGRDLATRLELDYLVETPGGPAEFSLKVTDAVAADLGTQVPALSWLSALQANTDATLSTTVLPDGQLAPVKVSVDLGAGALHPSESAEPIQFDAAKAHLVFDASAQRVAFDSFELRSGLGALKGRGQAILQDFRAGKPNAIVGQFTFEDVAIGETPMFENPQEFDRAQTDIRVTLAPFSVDFGHFSLGKSDWRLDGNGTAFADEEGWTVGFNLKTERATPAEFLAIWPVDLGAKTRVWFSENVLGGAFEDFHIQGRVSAGERPKVAMSGRFSDARFRLIKTLPPLENATGTLVLGGDRMTIVTDAGVFQAPKGGTVTVTDSVFQIADTTIKNGAPAQVSMQADGAVTAVLSLLDEEPFRFLSKANLPVDFAAGEIAVAADINFPLRKGIAPEDVRFETTSVLQSVETTQFLDGRRISAERLDLIMDNRGAKFSGRTQVETSEMVGALGFGFGENAAPIEITADVSLDQNFLDTFNITLPEGAVRGAAPAQLTVSFAQASPRFSLRSNLQGVALALDPIGWAKPETRAGSLFVSGQLGDQPAIETLTVEAPGLTASGSVRFSEAGEFGAARFERVQIGNWFDGPVTLVGQGTGQPLRVEVNGGELDFADATLGGGSSDGDAGVLSVRLDRLQVTKDIALTEFSGEFDGARGMAGRFNARINGGTPVTGRVFPHQGNAAVEITSDDAGGVFRSAGFLKNAHSGQFELSLLPTGRDGEYDGDLAARGLRVRDAPVLANLLDVISIVGLLQQLDGQGILISELNSKFRLAPDLLTIQSGSAFGPSMGISLDGYYHPDRKNLDFQGVISPLYILNGIGSIFTRKGEGLIGFNYTVKGPQEDVRVEVNPLSVFTPAMFREIFRRPVPELQ